MKLRIKGNSLRFRLTKSEVDYFGKAGLLEEKTEFDKSAFTYALQVTDKGNRLSVIFNNNKITLLIPSQLAKEWTETNLVGYENEIETCNGKKLFLLLEKDFKCHDNKTEDQSDHFENPITR
jgi:hypothetical protein